MTAYSANIVNAITNYSLLIVRDLALVPLVPLVPSVPLVSLVSLVSFVCCFVARHREKQQSNKQQTSTRAQEGVSGVAPQGARGYDERELRIPSMAREALR